VASRRLTVAVLDFESSDPTNPKLGEDISAALTALLCDQPGIMLVERRALVQTMQEHELNLTGVVDSRQAVKLGKLVGAQVIITGRTFRLGKEVFVTARLIGTNTSLVEGVLLKDTVDADMGVLVDKLSGKVAEKLRTAGPRLIDRPELPDPLPGLKKKLSGRRLPVVAVIVRERHHALLAGGKEGPPVEAAAETEIKRLLLECGFTVREIPPANRSGLFKDGKPADPESWPAVLNGVDVLIVGDAFSEYAARTANIVSCTARAEVSVSNREGKLLQAERVIERGADLSENIAAKKALQNSGREMGLRLLDHFAVTLPENSGHFSGVDVL
jgi:TolB-like protein